MTDDDVEAKPVKKKIKCPQCGSVIKVTMNPDGGPTDIKCKKCGKRGRLPGNKKGNKKGGGFKWPWQK